MKQPECELCPESRPGDYFDPVHDLTLCQPCAIDTGALTRGKCWTWNPNRKEFDK